ncbi:hypothetical protein FRC17_011225 [Serendipita sp. 399]|nr:hypothetical protein FRC17_011225 [Serendipita sp. 399]
MSNLKKRLGQAGVDFNNPKLNESFVLIGTPLPPLEKTKDANEFVPLWKQEVRDEKGRRRLHGAFTGGFSAGYFNTVGSKEGWTPSTFKSSRSDRHKGKEMRPEDFMDEEDRTEMQESRKLVDRDEAEDLQSRVFDDTKETDSISAALANMLPPINESIGAQLLKKMGWKPGQGIGPRLTYEQLKRRCEQDGTPLPAVDDAEATKHTYAPRDIKLPPTIRKDDFHGLGYVPDDWTPDPNRVWKSKWDVQPKPTNPLNTGSTGDHQQWKTGVSADERGAILGETPLPAAARSIWDYISAKDRERLQGLKNRQNVTRDVPPQPTPVHVVNFPRIDPVVAKAALLGFQPFKDNSIKQARYAEYLTAQASLQPVKLQPLPGQNIEEFNSELDSFAKAAQIFKPMSSAMASRFRSSTTIDTPSQQKEGLYQPTDEAYSKHEEETGKSTKMEVEETPREHAARLGMFGAMTREQKDWSPARLLCKRFKVPPPKVAASDAAEEADSFNQYTAAPPDELPQAMQVDSTPTEGAIRVVAAEGDGNKRDIANIGLGEDDTQGQDTLTYERPSMDIFKAIFASDEEDSDDEPGNEPEPSSSLIPSHVESNTAARPLPERPKTVTINEPVNLSTFKPTFVSRTDREKKKQANGGEEATKSSKKKSKAQGPVSFMEDDDVGLTVVPAAKKRKRPKDGDSKGGKKRKGDALDISQMAIDEEEDDSLWVEKEAPPVVQETASSSVGTSAKVEGPALGRNRPKAADFL